jgi:putative aminopeptidase FrvX
MNKQYILDFTKKVLSIDSPSGFTKNVINFLTEEATKLGYECEYNKKGNLIVTVKGQSDNVIGLSSHVDTLGLMVRSINGDGTLRITTIGGPLLPTYDGEYCKVYTRDGKVYSGTVLSNSPAAHVFKDASSLPRDADHMHIRLDEVVKSKADVKKLGIETGDFIAVDPKTVITENGFIKSRFLDDKMSSSILFGLLEYLKSNNITPSKTIKIMFSTYEEVGFGGSHLFECDEFIAVDMGCIGLDLNCTEYDVSICAKDSGGPYDYEITNKFIDIAKKLKLNYAIDIYPYYSSDATAALRAGNNIKAGLIGPGICASHGMERTHYDAVENTLKLLIEYIK